MKKIYLLLVFSCFGWQLSAQIINFPDANLKAKLLEASPNNMIASTQSNNYIKIDANNDGEIQVSEALVVYMLNLDNTPAASNDIVTMAGIENFSNLFTLSFNYHSVSSFSLSNWNNLTFLFCSNNGMTSVNLTNLNNLYAFSCNVNNLSTLNLSNLPSLFQLNCASNPNLNTLSLSNLNSFITLTASNCHLTSLNLNNLPLLEVLNLESNFLTSLDLTAFPTLKHISCPANQLTTLNVSNLTNLISLHCALNQLQQLDMVNKPNLTTLICAVNQISYLDVSDSPALTMLYCFENQLTQLFIKNGVNFLLENANGIANGYKLYGNPNLVYVCADDAKIPSLTAYLNIPNLTINSYCSFVPGGTLYGIQGTVIYDQNQNGCDSSDLPMPNLNLSVTNGTNNFSYINSGSAGAYSQQLNSGNYSITPQLENANYFTVSPSSYTVTFPTNASPFTQNFCLSSTGNHNDLEVLIIPVGIARPGFDADYRIIYKNKGTTTQTGTLNFGFNDTLSDFFSSSPSPSVQAVNNLSWNFTNLQPLESRQITLTLNLNSPTETPPLNTGTILNFEASVTGQIDEMPLDNIATLNQGVVNSFDPNDKICLEGTTIPLAKVGEYVHYRIRFENTGTANAQNIVVKDIVDTTRFDVASLVPIDGSHPFVTRITNTNQVEFIFQDIQLPFDDANNDGYVVFKIKTKPTLIVGNTFSNTASIYFDYNFPIVTETYTTTVAALAQQDFEFSDYFSLSPNPAKNLLNIQQKEGIEIRSISIYNVVGQLMVVVPNAKETQSVDVSHLTTGNYFVKFVSNKGTATAKFIKE